jgi:hypothetical protein
MKAYFYVCKKLGEAYVQKSLGNCCDVGGFGRDYSRLCVKAAIGNRK